MGARCEHPPRLRSPVYTGRLAPRRVLVLLAMLPLSSVLVATVLPGCGTAPIRPPDPSTIAALFGPSAKYGVRDGRGRFREIYCAVNADHGQSLPDYRPCEAALARIEPEPPPTGRPVRLSPAPPRLRLFAVLGLGADCFLPYLGDHHPAIEHLETLGHRMTLVPVEGLASSERNAAIIRDAVLAPGAVLPGERAVLLGYSKGAPDILTALVKYPELAERVSAVVSAAGAVFGSPLADDASQTQANLLSRIPGSGCELADEGAVHALRTDTRATWLRNNPLPDAVRYYSLITFPRPENISLVLQPSYRTLSEVDPRNDSQVVVADQVLPGSTVLAFLDADHWAVAVPVDRSLHILASALIDHNDFPREVLLEAVARYLQEELAADRE